MALSKKSKTTKSAKTSKKEEKKVEEVVEEKTTKKSTKKAEVKEVVKEEPVLVKIEKEEPIKPKKVQSKNTLSLKDFLY